MVQNISTQAPNQYGSINRIGTTSEGRVVYQVIDSNQQNSIKLSVAAKDADVFEKSYNDVLKSAPKLKDYAEKNPPEKIEKKRKIAKWLVGGCVLVGGLIPAIATKGSTLKQVGLTLLGTAGGFVTGLFGASKLVSPPGVKEFARASQTISKLDIEALA